METIGDAIKHKLVNVLIVRSGMVPDDESPSPCRPKPEVD